MYQTIHETIAVVGVYAQEKFTPKKFLWNKKVYRISNITMVITCRDGGVMTRRYSVSVGANMYQLLFNPKSDAWYLEAVWCD